jgi:hypothetical protein
VSSEALEGFIEPVTHAAGGDARKAVAGELVAVAVFGVASGVGLGAAGSRAMPVPHT